MLFFQEYPCRKLSKTKNNRTSPVRNSFYCMRIMHVFREKRALSPASRPLSNSADGSLALEAALGAHPVSLCLRLPGGPDQAV